MARSNDKTLAILTHIIPIFTYFIGPLVVLLVSEDSSVKKHARNALNWQISLILYYMVSVVLMLIYIGLVLIVILVVLNLVFCITAAVKASEGKYWKYPLSLPFLK